MTSTNAQKTPIGLSLNRHARAKALDQIWKRGLSLPCQVVAVRGSIVQVSFQVQQAANTAQATIPNVTIPIGISEYTRLPIQVGCKGVAVAMDAYLGGMSGIGGGVATLTQQGNLTALVFFPISNNGWFSVDGNILTLYGPHGVKLQDPAGNTILTVDQAGNAVVHGIKSYSWDVNGYGQRVTYAGGSAFVIDQYVTGASVTTNTLAWSPPKLPDP